MSKSKKVMVAQIPYTIVFFDDSRIVGADKREASVLLGQCDYVTRTLRAYNSPIKEETAQSFLHELVHAIVCGYHITTLSSELGEHNESMIDLMAVGLKESLSSLGINILDKIK